MVIKKSSSTLSYLGKLFILVFVCIVIIFALISKYLPSYSPTYVSAQELKTYKNLSGNWEVANKFEESDQIYLCGDFDYSMDGVPDDIPGIEIQVYAGQYTNEPDMVRHSQVKISRGHTCYSVTDTLSRGYYEIMVFYGRRTLAEIPIVIE